MKIIKNLCFGFMVVALIHTSSVFAVSANKMVKFDENGSYVGLTDEAKTLITESREALLKRKEVFSEKFKQFETIYHVAHLMRMIKGNMFLYGPPGGAKSLFVNWILDREKEKSFKIQMHQMMTEQAFIGGVDYEVFKKGKYKVNTDGSLVMHKTAVIDEMDKGNPATLAALLSLLNERKVYFGNTVVDSLLETIFTTSNKNLYEIYAEFEKNGQGSTADALLNRFSSVAFVPNWLPVKDQLALDRSYLKNLDDDFFATREEINKLSLQLDWDGLRDLARVLFVPTDDVSGLVRELVNKLREKSIEFIAKYDSLYYNDYEKLKYYPTVQYTERLRQKVIDVILMSLTLEFLTSCYAEDVDTLERSLKATKKHRFSVTPLSLWRAYPILTTVSYGVTKLSELEDHEGFGVFIDFGDFLDSYKGENKRVDQMIEYIKEERNAFKETLDEVWNDHLEAVKSASSTHSLLSCYDGSAASAKKADIERMLFSEQKKNESK